MKERLVYLTSIATPQQIKFCNALQEFFEARFCFYESAERSRGSYWNTDLGPHCEILPDVVAPYASVLGERYWAKGLLSRLRELDPDILMLGGFSIPSNYIAYRWARSRRKRTIVFTERSRTADGMLRQRSPGWRLLRWLYRDVDLVMVSADDAVEQFRDEFGFGSKVVAGRYASDLDDYFTHPLRTAKPAYTYLFANRLTPIYNPLGAIEIFDRIRQEHGDSRLLMNASGELMRECRAAIEQRGLQGSVTFLDELKSWTDLNLVYARSDILLLPAQFSNGNFTILEAMASGMGIVVSDKVLGIGKMVRDGQNGFNCEPTTEAFVDRIRRYIARPELLRAHAEANRPTVASLGAKGTARFFNDLVRERLQLRDDRSPQHAL